MRARYTVWPLIFMILAGICWAQEGEKQRKEGEKPSPSTTAGAQTAAPQPAHGFKAFTPEEIARKNPQKFTTVSVERGKKIYVTQCLMCHGEKGEGKTELASEMGLKVPDFAQAGFLGKRTDGELFAIIESGSPDMPGQGTRMKDHHKWQLINYLRSIAGKVPERSTGNEPEEGVLLIPQ